MPAGLMKLSERLDDTHGQSGVMRIILPVLNNCVMANQESFSAHGETLLKKVKELIDEGNIRKITITDKAGKEMMSFPLTVGIVGALLAPVLAAIGAMAALIGECTITVERHETEDDAYDHLNN